MKRIIILTLILLLIFPTVILADSGIKFEAGLFEMKDADDYLSAGRINFKTDLFVLLNAYDFLEVQYLRAGDFDSQLSYEHAIHDLNLLMINQASYRLNDLNIGLGAKYLLIENSADNSSVLAETELHNNNYIDIEAYGLPLVISDQNTLSDYIKVELQGALVALGRYTIPLADRDDIEADFRGYGVEATLKIMTHEDFAFQVGGSWQRYEFLADESSDLSQKFIDDQKGLYSGIEITW